MSTKTVQPTHANGFFHSMSRADLLDASIFKGHSNTDEPIDFSVDFSFSSFPVIHGLADVDFGQVMAAWRQTQIA